ncbi:MAG TPA: hypothetical protein VE443_03065 [Beijerinckiaceae bacterium]|jgi:plasmid stability protein|nr:hypothetical protein [Microvirga sp.]HZB36969.1 hypothetical protein [Beijerinckiaceae bacterium]
MGDLLIRDVDDGLMQRLKAKAEINGTSMQQEAKKALQRGSPLTPHEKRALFAELDRLWGDRPQLSFSSAEIIRELREEEG